MKLLDKILLAQDFSKSSENVVDNVIELAKIFHSRVIPMFVISDDTTNEKMKSLLYEAAMKKLEETGDRIESQGVKVGKPILEFGNPHDGIVQTAISVSANMILIGSGESQKGDKFRLGMTAKRIIQKSEKPVYIVKEGVPLNVQNILCPVDFSRTSKRALKNAITMSRRFKAELTVLSVCESQDSTWFMLEKESKNENNRKCAQHKVKFDKFLQAFNFSGLKWTKEIRKGNPAEEILSTISEKMVDLLVMGTVGRTGLNRLMIGSVAEKVAREVPCSFIMLKSEDIINLQLETNVRDIENHYKIGMQLMEDGFYAESIDQFKVCLNINSMHVPSYYAMAKVYEKLNNPEKVKIYKDGGKEIMDRIWDRKIEQEVRKFYR